MKVASHHPPLKDGETSFQDPMPAETHREERAKEAGRLLYDGVHNGHTPPLASTIPPPIPGYDHSTMVEAEVTLDPLGRNGKMSSVRRTFCLVVTFDLILMFILWVIFTQLIGGDDYAAFEKQVLHYTFRTSLFDAVMLSAFRFVILLLSYCLFRLRHWIMVAICTAASSAVLIAKIFVYDFQDSRNNPLSYVLIIIAFVLAWLETWFLDFKVLPHEKKLELRLRAASNARAHGGYGSTSRVGSHYRRFVGDDMQSIITEDNSQFYSPLDSPNDSDQEDGPRRTRGGGDFKSLPASSGHTRQENDYISLGKHSFEVLWSYVKSPEEDWKLESGKDLEVGIVHSKKIKGVGKVFRLQAIVDMEPRRLYNETSLKQEEGPSWNYTLTECRTLQVVGENCDVLYTVSGEVAGGVISSRDFINVRHWGERDGVLLGAGMACNHPDMPPQKNHIRGVNGAGGWVYKQVPEDPDKCLFVWFMNTDIKGWFPQKLIDANMAKVQLDFLGHLRAYVERLKEASAPS